MPKDTLQEREFELVNIVGAKIASTQRDLSRHMDLSLGMTNMLLRRMITKGYIRIRQLNQRKVEYLLTPKGFSEKMRKAIKYTLKTVDSIGMIRNRLKVVLLKLYEKGERNFFILGRSDLAVLVEMAFKEISTHDCHVEYVEENYNGKTNGILLICTENYKPEANAVTIKSINLIEELAKDATLLNIPSSYK